LTSFATGVRAFEWAFSILISDAVYGFRANLFFAFFFANALSFVLKERLDTMGTVFIKRTDANETCHSNSSWILLAMAISYEAPRVRLRVWRGPRLSKATFDHELDGQTRVLPHGLAPLLRFQNAARIGFVSFCRGHTAAVSGAAERFGWGNGVRGGGFWPPATAAGLGRKVAPADGKAAAGVVLFDCAAPEFD
jgi:hypothetical protein